MRVAVQHFADKPYRGFDVPRPAPQGEQPMHRPCQGMSTSRDVMPHDAAVPPVAPRVAPANTTVQTINSVTKAVRHHVRSFALPALIPMGQSTTPPAA